MRISTGWQAALACATLLAAATAAVFLNPEKSAVKINATSGSSLAELKLVADGAGPRGGIPPSQTFDSSTQWQEIRLPLTGFDGLDLAQVVGFSFNASNPVGQFRFTIDNVEIK